MLGSTASIASPNIILNTIVSEALCQFADELEQADDFNTALHELIVRTIKKHKRIIFNGNGYDDAWIKEAEGRGLHNLRTTPDCLPHFADEPNIELFEKHRVFTRQEVYSRCEIMLENYRNVLRIEALTMLDMARKDILPAATAYVKTLCDTVISKKSVGIALDCQEDEALILKLSGLTNALYKAIDTLERMVDGEKALHSAISLAEYYRDRVVTAMNDLRRIADELEKHTAKSFWPYPTYVDLLFSI